MFHVALVMRDESVVSFLSCIYQNQATSKGNKQHCENVFFGKWAFFLVEINVSIKETGI